jgi:hypothetical protein
MVPMTSTVITASHWSGSASSTGAVGPAMPALFTSTSSPPSASTEAAIMRSISSRFDTSQTTVFKPGISFAAVSSAFSSMSQTQVAPVIHPTLQTGVEALIVAACAPLAP